jgi:hypothetical protein
VYRVTPAPLATTTRDGGGLIELPLRLTDVRYRRFTEHRSRVGGPAITRYFADLTSAFDVPGMAAGQWQADGTTYAEMAAAMLTDLGAPDVDLVVLATAAPDLDPWRSAATYVNHALCERPLLFRVTEQGPAATYTALRLAGDLAGRHGLRTVLVLAMDQATLPYPVLKDELSGDAAVALVLGRGSGELFVGQRANVSTVELSAAVDALVPELAAPWVVAGPKVGALPARLPVSDRAPLGLPCSAGWAVTQRPAVWVDHDPVAGDLSVCVAVEEVDR